jgi:tetratricopeptide (TPR) repeat protein
MSKLALSPKRVRARQQPTDALASKALPGGRNLYFAFLSYSHNDETTASWLHDQLENFRIPSSIVGRLTEHGAVPRRLTPIFRDRRELAAGGELAEELKEALAASRFLIVICSPAAASSSWTNAEIDLFKRTRPDGCVIAAIVDGEPFASSVPGREHEECLPPALRVRYDRRGRPTSNHAEPMAADLRDNRDGKRLGLLKIVAGMLGIGLDDLVQREALRRQRRLAMVAAASLFGMLVTTGLALTAIHARDAAHDQRQEAEGLVGFMLGDLRAKLEPLGRLDVLDGVGARVLAYYQKQSKSELSDAALLQRSQALALMAGVANSRGDLDGALRLYREAMVGTSEAIRRQPDDPKRLFEHAQNVFWTADIASRRGNAQGAVTAFREYKRLAAQMVALDPDNMQWRMESQNADTNLAVVLYQQRRFPEAARLFEQSLRTIEAISTADPDNVEYRNSLVESLAWAADAHLALGRIPEATAKRQRHVALLESSLESSNGDVYYGHRLVPAHGALGNLYAWRGRLDLAIPQLQKAVAQAERLLSTEAENSRWLEFAAKGKLNLADLLIASGRLSEATRYARSGCALTNALALNHPGLAHGRARLRDCLLTRANLALALGQERDAVNLGMKAIEAAVKVKGSDPVGDAYMLAKAHRLTGDAHRSAGNREAAGSAWARAVAVLPKTVGEQPTEARERELVLRRTGRTAEAEELARKLAAIGYREVQFRRTQGQKDIERE